ncbi:hypothetical protein [Nonomuraea insulae]|uniref:Uncharacterized protein n=1 Tax=Nonomuraea insulae TaxID=1616787 RepID=A0ABW1CTW1_9ACTN
MRFIDLDLKRARYLKLQVDSIWAAPSAPNFYQKLRVDELWAGGLYPRR